MCVVKRAVLRAMEEASRVPEHTPGGRAEHLKAIGIATMVTMPYSVKLHISMQNLVCS